jgi:hypothetical protein
VCFVRFVLLCLALISFYFSNLFISYFYTFPYFFQPGYVPTPSPTAASSRGGGGPSSVAVSSARHLLRLLLRMKFERQTSLREPQKYEGVCSLSGSGTWGYFVKNSSETFATLRRCRRCILCRLPKMFVL